MHTAYRSLPGSSLIRALQLVTLARSLAVISLTFSSVGCAQSAPLKALMLVGGQAHDYDSLPVQLAERLNQRGEIAVEVTSDIGKIDRKSLRDYQVFIVNTCHRPSLTEEFKQAVVEHVESGKGLVVVHCSLWSYLDWPEWTRMIGGRVETHDKYTTYDVAVLDPAHATMTGLGNRFSITDEPYLVDDRDPDAVVLIETAEPRHDTKGELRSGRDPQAWVKRFGKGRIFVTTFGHDAAAQQSESFLALMHNGIRWAGGSIRDHVHNQLTGSERSVGFELLFNGRDLSGWRGDEGLWTVERGELVGRAKDLQRCNFLMPTRQYGDFIMRLSFRLMRGNSGIQIRSQEQPADPKRPLKGYHVEIVADKWGSLYDYGGPRKVLSNELSVEASRKLVVPEGWNDMTIQACGPDIIVRVNGVITTRFAESDPTAPRSGVVGFQLHRGPEPTELRLRDVRIRRITPADLDPQTRPD